MFEVGDKIKIINVEASADMFDYIGRTGEITKISKGPYGDTYLYGTWGECLLDPDEDTIVKLEK